MECLGGSNLLGFDDEEFQCWEPWEICRVLMLADFMVEPDDLHDLAVI